MAKIIVTASRKSYQTPQLMKRDKLAQISGLDTPIVLSVIKPTPQ